MWLSLKAYELEIKPCSCVTYAAFRGNCLYNLQSTARSHTEPQEIDATDFGPEQSLQRAQMHKRILQALETLPPLSREAIVLSRFSGLSNNEIAQLLTLTPNNVKVRIHRALAKLKEALYDP